MAVGQLNAEVGLDLRQLFEIVWDQGRSDSERNDAGNVIYDRYVKPLEASHLGKMVAVSEGGQITIAATSRDLTKLVDARHNTRSVSFRIGPRVTHRLR